jgi:hypothetical protein
MLQQETSRGIPEREVIGMTISTGGDGPQDRARVVGSGTSAELSDDAQKDAQAILIEYRKLNERLQRHVLKWIDDNCPNRTPPTVTPSEENLIRRLIIRADHVVVDRFLELVAEQVAESA